MKLNLSVPQKLRDFAEKYRFVGLVLLLGIVLLALPSEKDRKDVNEFLPVSSVTETEKNVEEQLEALLSQVEGAGRVSVMLTVEEGEYTVLQTDSLTENRFSDSSEEESLRQETVFLERGSGGSEAIPVQTCGPVYRGAVVVAEGADQASVKLDLVSAVMSLTGLKADKITVIKMKSN